MKETATNKIWLGYTAALVLFIIAFAYTFTNSARFSKYSSQLNSTKKYVEDIENLVMQSKSVDKIFREYFFTKQDSIENLFYIRLDELRESVFTHVQSGKFSKEEKVSLNFLINLFAEYKMNAHQGIIYFKEHNKTVDDSLRLYSFKCLMIIDNIATRLYAINKSKRDELDTQLLELNKSYSNNKTINLILFILAVFLSVYASLIYLREHRENRRKTNTIENYSKELEERVNELNEANSELSFLRSNEKFASIGRMARTFSHEIRNPLTNVNLAADQLKEGMPESEDNKTLFDMMLRNTTRINELITNLLNSTKLLDLDLQWYSVNAIIDNTLELAQDRIKLKGIKLIKYYNSNAEIKADKSNLQIALLNIIINAVEAMEELHNPVLTVSSGNKDNRTFVRIEDNGTGMSQDALTKLFDPYYTSKTKGMGLGLVNTQNIILSHKGDIEVSSELGKGTVFTIYFPVEK